MSKGPHVYLMDQSGSRVAVYPATYLVRLYGNCSGMLCNRQACMSILENHFLCWYCEECVQDLILTRGLVPVTPEEFHGKKSK